MLFFGLLAIVPGIGVLGGAGLAVLGYQMLRAHDVPILPRALALRPLPASRVARLVRGAVPVIEVLERFVRPRWPTPFRATKQLVGLIVLSLAVTIFIPIPLSNIVPGILTMLVAFAYLEEDGLLLSLVLGFCMASLALSATELWGGLRGLGWVLLQL